MVLANFFQLTVLIFVNETYDDTFKWEWVQKYIPFKINSWPKIVKDWSRGKPIFNHIFCESDDA